MGATVLCNKRVYAFRTIAGTVMYLVFENTYEKNCYPHVPSVSCVAFGPIARVMNWVVRSASSASGGMLQSRRGDIDALTHLRSYRRALAAPEWLDNFTVTLRANSEFRASIPLYLNEEDSYRNLDLAVSECAKHGRGDLARALLDGNSVELEAYRDGELLASIYDDCGTGPLIAPWRVFSPPRFSRGPDKKLAPPKAKPDPTALPRMQLYRLDEPTELTRQYHHSVNLLLVDGFTPRFDYAAYEGPFIDSVVSKLEADRPGQAEIALERFRNLGSFENAPLAPGNTVFQIDRAKVVTDWQKESYAKLSALLNRSFTENMEQMLLTLQDVRIAESAEERDNPVFRLLRYLGDAVTITFGAATVAVPTEQSDTFASAT